MKARFGSLLVLFPLLAQAAEALPQNEIEIGGTRENLDHGFADWSSLYITGAHRFAPRQVIYGSMSGTQRFDRKDNEFLAGTYLPIGDAWTAVIEASGSTTHRILAKRSLFAQLEGTLPGGWGVQGGIRRTAYNETDTTLLTATVERYWGNWRAGYSLYASRPDNAGTAIGHRLAVTRYYGDRSSLDLAYITGEEVENVPARGVVTTDVKSYALTGRHWFLPDWAVSFQLLLHEQGELYTRQGLRLGLRHRF